MQDLWSNIEISKCKIKTTAPPGRLNRKIARRQSDAMNSYFRVRHHENIMRLTSKPAAAKERWLSEILAGRRFAPTKIRYESDAKSRGHII
jgi:hypothetical protein